MKEKDQITSEQISVFKMFANLSSNIRLLAQHHSLQLTRPSYYSPPDPTLHSIQLFHACLVNKRMGSKVMPPANFHRYYKWKDRIHVLYVFSNLTPFIRCINYTCRHSISREIFIYTNPTHKRLGKMGGGSIENTNEISTDIKTRALLSRSSTDIYADIYTIYGSNLISFSTVCRWVWKFSADVGPVISAPKSGRSKSASSLKTVEIFFSADCEHVWNVKSTFIALLAKYFETEEGKL